MKDIQYFAPADVGEAVKLLAEHGGRVTILAGGTDLVPKINYYELSPDILMYIGGLSLDYIKDEDGTLVIGATTSTAKLATSDLVKEKAAALARAARLSGSVATRTSATIGGNIANASPAADLVTPLLVMDAELRLRGPSGERVVALKDFFTGPGETVLRPDELVVEVAMPVPRGNTVFLKLGRRKALTFAVVNVAVWLELDGEKCRDARIALGSVAPTPVRCLAAEALIRGKRLDKTSIVECAAAAVAETHPIDDQRASAWYRRKASAPLVARALAQAAGVEI
ncbi:MAG: xanthine dehydrogenase family protein subunit M [Ardenticatenaceae bacterium]|nr:xanthine dehydrogenase family protein subunit M [Ardenticatenaceae bacterium]HBY96101.1 xanthine dehydrogenase family protein subunit M [Chloroflexota bacterium]